MTSANPVDASPAPGAGERREEILTAAFRCLARSGLSDVTMQQIADQAGVSKGMLHYYFENKDNLIAELLEVQCRLFVDHLRAALAVETEPRQRISRGLDEVWSMGMAQRDYFIVFFEMLAHGARHPAVGQRVSRLYREYRQLVEDEVGRLELPPGRSPAALAAVVVAGIEGVVLQAIADPRLELSGAVDVLKLMVAAALEPAR
ncbi:MAG: TetR/AcrR family transcriptional regulator [Candidatus Dormibacteria bacterium]